MDKEQVRVLKSFGYTFGEVENLHQEPRATYYRVINGEVSECPDLPADPYSLQHYLAKGFTLTQPELKPQTVTSQKDAQEGKFVCQVCGKSFNKRIALIGHSRKHDKK